MGHPEHSWVILSVAKDLSALTLTNPNGAITNLLNGRIE